MRRPGGRNYSRRRRGRRLQQSAGGKRRGRCARGRRAAFARVGAGGDFSKVLAEGGAGAVLAEGAKHLHVSVLVLGWLIAAAIRVAVGSATAAIALAASLIAPIAAASPGTNRELLVISLGAGATILSHLNDGGFWFVKEYFGMTVPQTLKSWTVMETIISVVGLLLVLVFDGVLKTFFHG